MEVFDEEYGLPSHENLGEFNAYMSSTNYERKIPNWSLQILDSSDSTKNRNEVDRKFSNFTNSIPNVPDLFKASNEDYLKSGWSRGHLCPASDAKNSQIAMNETFYLNSNIVPQNLSNNVDFWYRLEVFVRKRLLHEFDKVVVVSGPLFLPIQEENKKYIKYEVIGKNNVAVPTHLYKVILTEKNDQKWIEGFVIPNEPIRGKSLLDYRQPLESIEKSSGLQFFPKRKPLGHYVIISTVSS
jgi:DNA/RNA endonuclease G (NUC1)